MVEIRFIWCARYMKKYDFERGTPFAIYNVDIKVNLFVVNF